MDKELAGRLNTLFGEEERFNIFLEYLESKEDLIHRADLNDTDTDNRWRTQGKLKFISELKGLRDNIRISIKGE